LAAANSGTRIEKTKPLTAADIGQWNGVAARDLVGSLPTANFADQTDAYNSDSYWDNGVDDVDPNVRVHGPNAGGGDRLILSNGSKNGRDAKVNAALDALKNKELDLMAENAMLSDALASKRAQDRQNWINQGNAQTDQLNRNSSIRESATPIDLPSNESERSDIVRAYDAKVLAGTYSLTNELNAVWSGSSDVIDKLSGTWTLMTYECADDDGLSAYGGS